MKKGDGKSKTYVCPQDGCSSDVRVTKRKRFGSSPEHYISTLKIRHADVCVGKLQQSLRKKGRLCMGDC